MEDVSIGLLTVWRKGVGEERCFMKGECVLLIDFLFNIYFFSIISIFNSFIVIYNIFVCDFFASFFSKSSKFFMPVSFASSKSCTFCVLIVGPLFSA